MAFAWVQRPVVYEAAPGEQRMVRFPDGSVVTLSGGSTIQRTRLWGAPLRAARATTLTGEAFFDVTPSETPFIVQTFDAEVTVLGTEFGVRAWPDEPEAATRVALLSGQVRLSARPAFAGAPATSMVLTPGQVARVGGDEGLAVVPAETVEDALAWRAGDFVYKNQPLGLVVQDVERRFGIIVSLAPDALAHQRVSVALRAPDSVASVMHDLALALGLRYRTRAGGFELYRPSAAPSRPPSLRDAR